MAKIPCEIIRDLLPLYQDDICSEKSRNAIEEHIKECESCRTYLKKMEGEIPVETDKIEDTDEEWKGFREFSEKVSRKLNGRIVIVCGVVFLICMMLTVALYSDAFQSYHLSRIAAEDIKAEEVYRLKDGRLYVHVKSKRRITGLSYPQTDIDTDTNTAAGKDAAEKYNNLTTAMWASMRDLLDNKQIVIEDDEQTVGQLSSRKYTMTSNGKLEIESKKEMKKRGLDSPDRADALALALYLGKIKKHTGTAPGVKELQELTKDNYWG